MAAPVDKFKLPTGMGRLLRYSPNGPWTWRRYDTSAKKQVCTSTGETNKSRAEQFVYQQMAIKDEGRLRLQGVKILFKTVVEEYIVARKTGRQCKKLRPGSLTKLQTAINSFKGFVGPGYNSLQIDHVDSTMLQHFVDREADRVTPSSANANLSFVLQLLSYAHSKRYIARNPGESVVHAFENDLNSEDDEGIVGWPCPTPEEVRLILAHANPKLAPTGRVADNGSKTGRKVYKGINKNDFTDLYSTICMTGMRLGEARFLTWHDVELQNRIIRIRPGMKNGIYWCPKTRLSIRRIAIVPDMEVVLERLRQANRKDQWVFETKRGTQLSASNPTQRLGEICDELGLGTRYVLHSLRKYWASTVAQQGMDWRIMLKMFGHSDFKLILSTYYAQNDDARLVGEASKIDFGLGLPKIA